MEKEAKKRGRRPVDDKKVRVVAYVRQSDVDWCGGMPFAQKIAETQINKLANEAKNSHTNGL